MSVNDGIEIHKHNIIINIMFYRFIILMTCVSLIASTKLMTVNDSNLMV